MLFEAMSEGFALHEIVCDAAGRPIDYRFLEVNPAFERMTGLRATAVVGHTVREVLPGLEPFWIERCGQVALTGRPADFESYVRELNRWYEVHAFSAQRGQFAVVFVDITDRKSADETFRQAVADHALEQLHATLREFQHGEGLAMNLHRLALSAQNVDLLCQGGDEKGFSTKGEGRGSGLAFARDHVAKYGGTVDYDESYTGGARFRVRLVRV